MPWNKLSWLALALVCAALIATTARGEAKDVTPTLHRTWSKETLKLASTLPIQDRGRIKPMSTVAGYAMLGINHKRTHINADGAKREPMQWFLDCWLFPDLAEREKFFVVTDSAVLKTLEIEVAGKKKRDRYSYAELRPGVGKLFELAHEYGPIKEKDRDRLQSQIVILANAVHAYERIAHYLAFAHAPMQLEPPLHGLFGKKSIWVSDFLTALPEVARKTQKSGSGLSPDAQAAFSRLSRDLERRMVSARGLVFFPPPAGSTGKEWMTAFDVVELAVTGFPVAPAHIKMLQALEKMRSARTDPAAVNAAMREFHKGAVDLAKERGEYDKVELEVFYYKQDPFYRSLYVYLLGFILVALTWLLPHVRRLRLASIIVVGGALLYHTYGLVLRCILRSRPPVSNLYETIIFITAIVVAVALVLEYINRRGIGLGAAPALGVIGLFVAHKFELTKKEDTIAPLIAVLDTNFWLATHVTAITIGYAGGLLAGALGHIYVIGRAFKKGSEKFYSSLGRMVYGTICFSLIFSVVGTILGGVWANESWGRFWGWDPKENGALLIVLYQLVLIHARLGGYIKSFGISMVAILGNIVIGFSWWGVNALGVGLHSYGFTSSISRALAIFYAVEVLVFSIGAVYWFLNTRPPRATSAF